MYSLRLQQSMAQDTQWPVRCLPRLWPVEQPCRCMEDQRVCPTCVLKNQLLYYGAVQSSQALQLGCYGCLKLQFCELHTNNPWLDLMLYLGTNLQHNIYWISMLMFNLLLHVDSSKCAIFNIHMMAFVMLGKYSCTLLTIIHVP